MSLLEKKTMLRIKQEIMDGKFDKDDFLTARFDIPSVLITTAPKQAGKEINLYDENLLIDNDPVVFEKNGKIPHKSRVVESYILNDIGERLSFENTIRTSQLWQLQKDQPGRAEMSANLEDLLKNPDGDVVIDPSLSYASYSYYNVNTMDARLGYNDNAYYGGAQTMTLSQNDRAIIACDLSGLSYNKAITDIHLKIYMSSNTFGSTAQARIYNVSKAWTESNVNWYNSNSGVYWNSGGVGGGAYEKENAGNALTIPSTAGWVNIDLTRPFNARYSVFDEIDYKGFLLKFENSPGSGGITFNTKEYTDPLLRWSMEVSYYTDARTQSVWYRPFLKKRDGDILTPSDRWFPIGWFLQITDNEPTPNTGYEDDNVRSLSDGFLDANNISYNDTNIYNCFVPKVWEEQRNKRASNHVQGCNGVPAGGFPALSTEIDDYQAFLDTLSSIYTSSSGTKDYYLIPSVIQADKYLNTSIAALSDVTFADYAAFCGASSAPKYNISETAYTQWPTFPFSWDDENETLGNLIDDTKNYPSSNPRIRGWNFWEEFLSIAYVSTPADAPYIRQIRKCYENYTGTILSHDNSSTGKYPIYGIEQCGLFYWGYLPDDIQGEVIYQEYGVSHRIPPSEYHYNYIFEDASYYPDIASGGYWENSAYITESAMRYTNVGYCRCINSTSGGSSYTPGPNGNVLTDKYRYLPYSSWVVGGQGLMIWGLYTSDTPQWFYLCHQMAREAYGMKDYLMNEPALDIPAIIYDSSASTNHSKRTRFILRRNQNNPTSNQFLVLFCNFANDGQSHSTYIHFPNNTISNINRVANTPTSWNFPQIIDSNKTLYYMPESSCDSKDVYGRAFLITLN